jgi:ATP-dependent DNA helicase RecQ
MDLPHNRPAALSNYLQRHPPDLKVLGVDTTVATGGHVMSLLDMCRRTVRRTFFIERLRCEQESLMVALKGRDALVALATGFAKSLIYQVPAIILDRPTIVVSPLIALMADQERTLRTRHVPVFVLHSRLRLTERRAALAQHEGGGRLVVLTTPETLE